MKPTLRYLSLGAGVQSTALALMIAHGEVDAVDCAIFADTGWEPAEVYRHLEWLRDVLPYPVHAVTAGNLRDHVLHGSKANNDEGVYRGVPLYVRPGANGRDLGMTRRQCTREYKIAPITAKVRELLGLGKGQRVPAGVVVEQLTGISSDEADRAKPAPEKWLHRLYPLLDLRITRMGCISWLREHGYPDPPRSACVGCPMHSKAEWQRIRRDPELWADAVEVDEAIRGGVVGGLTAREAFLHYSGRPLVDAVADTSGQPSLFGDHDDTDRGGWGNECEGMCGV